MRTAIRKNLADFLAILGVVLLGIGIGAYILANQRLRFPLVEDKPYTVKAELSDAQAVTPGQGQTVVVAGVRVGDIGQVELEDGKAVVELQLEPKYRGLLRQDASALLRAKTGTKDMFLEVDPGEGKPLSDGGRIQVSNTLPDIDPDEFLAALDADTRDYLKLLLNGARGGLQNRAGDLNAVLKRFEPTYRDLGSVQHEVAKRRHDLERLVNALNRLNGELGRSDDDLAQLVGASAKVFDAFAKERVNVASTVRELPSTLRQATDALGRVEEMAKVLGPSSEKLRPVARALLRANNATKPFALEAAPLLRDDIRPFVQAARPMVRELKPVAHGLVEAEPELKRSVHVLNRLFNLLAFNANGREPAGKEGRDEGYLFYFAWLAHQSVTIFSGQDAHGVFRPFIFGGTCNTIRNTAETTPGGAFIGGVTAILYDQNVCGGVAG
jgi:phospholipid/cholesterol/gamma-HCH transport system substrate-binding protein